METRPFNDNSFTKFLVERKLMGSRCSACRTLFVPPRSLCPKCHGWNMEWEQMKGTGKLESFTCISFPPPSLADEGYGRDNPYCTGVVALDENTRVVARIDGVDARDSDSIPIGMPVEIVFRGQDGVTDQNPIVTFQPLTSNILT